MKDCSDVGKGVIRTVERTAVVCPGRAGSGQFGDTSRDGATVMFCNRLRITQFASCHDDKDARPGATTDLHRTPCSPSPPPLYTVSSPSPPLSFSSSSPSDPSQTMSLSSWMATDDMQENSVSK